MIDQAISNLKSMDLIKQNDIVAACMDYRVNYFGGLIGAAVTASTIGYYILAASKDSIRLFDINKKTGEYMGTCTVFKREEIIKTSVSGLFGTLIIGLKTTSGRFNYSASKKFKGYFQKEELAKLKEFFKYSFK